jgi:hypothetical protein
VRFDKFDGWLFTFWLMITWMVDTMDDLAQLYEQLNQLDEAETLYLDCWVSAFSAQYGIDQLDSCLNTDSTGEKEAQPWS